MSLSKQLGFIGIPRGRFPTRNSRPGGGGGGGGGLTGLRWSSAATWGGSFPTANDEIIIGNGQTYILDTTSAAQALARNVVIQNGGLLTVDPAVNIKAAFGWMTIESGGELRWATEASKYTNKGAIEFNGALAQSPATTRYAANRNSLTGTVVVGPVEGGTGAASNEVITVTGTGASFTVNGSVSGALPSGTVGTEYNNRARFTVASASGSWSLQIEIQARAKRNDNVSRTLMVMPGGKIEVHGAFKTPRVKLNASAAAGANTFTLRSVPTNWQVGDKIAILPTDFRWTASGQSQEMTIASISGTTLTTVETLTAARWGVKQYPIEVAYGTTGMSLTPGTWNKPAATNQARWDAQAKELDESASIVMLSQHCVFEGANDADWTNSGFGFAGMEMKAAIAKLEGVEIRRGGQRGINAAYPWHWHMGSYEQLNGMSRPSSGVYTGAINPANQYFRACSIHTSEHRGLVIHATDGATIEDNILHNIRGHAVLFEDGSERGNFMRRNIVSKARSIANVNDCLLQSDHPDFGGGASGFWLSNFNQTFTGNEAFECEQWGIINACAMQRCIGLSQAINIVPSSLLPVDWSNNVAACNANQMVSYSNDAGMATAFPHVNNFGGFLDINFNPDPLTPIILKGAVLWKNGKNSYYNRGQRVDYIEWLCADNEGNDLRGAITATGNDGRGVSDIHSGLFVGESLNNATSRALATIRTGIASYHELADVFDCSFVNYPYIAPALRPGETVSPQGGGAIATWDLYTQPYFTFGTFTGLKFSNSVFGARVNPPHAGDGVALGTRNWTLAGVVNDVNGYATPAGKPFWILNHPHLTTGRADLQDTPLPTNAKATATRGFGIAPTWFSNEVAWNGSALVTPGVQYQPSARFRATRINSSNAAIATAWDIASYVGNNLIFRHTPVFQGDALRLERPGFTQTWAAFSVEGALDPTDEFVVSVQMDQTPTAFFNTYDATGANGTGAQTVPPLPSGAQISAGTAHNFTVAASVADVFSGAPYRYFHSAGFTYAKVRRPTTVGASFGGEIDSRHKPWFFVVR